MGMEIVIENDGLNGISNYEPLKAWALEEAGKYKGLIVQENALSFAKEDAAELRKMAKQASDLRIAIKKQHEEKIEKVISQLKEITDIFTQSADAIAEQVKGFEQKYKDEKKQAIEEYYESTAQELADVVPFERVFDPKWLNKGASMDAIQKYISSNLEKIRNGIRIIKDMKIKYESEMIATFLSTLDMSKALDRKNELEEQDAKMARMQRQEEQRLEEEKKHEEAVRSQIVSVPVEKLPSLEATPSTPAPVVQSTASVDDVAVPVDVRLFMTKKQKAEFRDFVISHGIKYTRVPSNN